LDDSSSGQSESEEEEDEEATPETMINVEEWYDDIEAAR